MVTSLSQAADSQALQEGERGGGKLSIRETCDEVKEVKFKEREGQRRKGERTEER